jgi:hypothetical protein
MQDVQEFTNNVMHYFDTNVLIDALNENKNGVIIVKTKQNILGEK